MTHPLDLSVPEFVNQFRAGAFSASEIVRATLERIERASELNAFLYVAAEASLLRAAELDRRRSRGEALGPLAAVPIAVKDALCTQDAPTTCGSKILTRQNGQRQAAWQPPYDASVVARLRAADAIIIGKTNMDEFAMGSSNENSAFGPVKNPWDLTRIPGGSSGGSAAAVAAGLTPCAIGSDTGGSIRQPAALCGIVGLKPSYGRVSRYGLVAFASSLDQVGPFGRDVRSTAQLFEVIAGFDSRDSTSSSRAVGGYLQACDAGVEALTIGVPEDYFADGLDPEVAASVRAAIRGLSELGCRIKPVSMPHTRYGVATYYIIATAEASSNLARFDGVRFGLRVEPPRGDLQAMYGATRDAGFGAEVKRRILLGTYVLSAGYYDAYYKKAQQARTLVRADFDRVFAEVDVLATPTSPTPAFKIGERVADPLAMYLGDVYTLPASLAGVCAISVPCAPVPASADRPMLPVGLQFLAPGFAEERLFRVAAAWEALSPAKGLRPGSQ